MQTTTNHDWLKEYVANESDAAFQNLVAHHVNLVYSVALRQVGQPQMAEEITQAVFILLARKARQLRNSQALASWLFQTARLTANNYLRSELRRRQREQEAYMQSVPETKGASEVWPQMAPMLDEAVEALGEKDRRAILLRYYEEQDLRTVSQTLGTSEAAAEKRVARALEKLRRFFSRHGVNCGAGAIAAALTTHAAQAAPASLAGAASAAALGQTVAGSVILTLIQETLKTMLYAKVKTAIIASSVALFLTLGGTMALNTVKAAVAEKEKVVLNHTASGTTSSGRKIQAAADVNLGISVQGERIKINFGDQRIDNDGQLVADHTLTVENNLIAIDGKERGKIEASATDLRATCGKGIIVFKADDKPVLTHKLGKILK